MIDITSPPPAINNEWSLKNRHLFCYVELQVVGNGETAWKLVAGVEIILLVIRLARAIRTTVGNLRAKWKRLITYKVSSDRS